LHAVCASASWYVPPAQGVHASCLGASVNDPLVHAVCCVEPVVAKWPGEASVHSLAAVRSVAVENVPFSHGSGAAAPDSQ